MIYSMIILGRSSLGGYYEKICISFGRSKLFIDSGFRICTITFKSVGN